MNDQIKKNIKMIFSRVWLMLVLAAAAAAVVYFSYGRVYEKLYEARVKLIITLSDANAHNASIFDSIRSSQMAVGDVCQIIASEAVLANVEKESGISQTYLGEALNINATPNTRVLDISIRMNSPELSLKIIESLDKNLREKLKEVDSSVTYKILSRPHVDLTPVNQIYPILFTIGAALGGLLLGGLINLILAEMKTSAGSLNHIHNLFKEENILPVPASKIPKHEGGVL